MSEGVGGFLAYLSVMHVAFSGFPSMQVWRSSSIYRFREILCFTFRRMFWLFCQGHLNAHKIHDIQEKVTQQNYNFAVVHL